MWTTWSTPAAAAIPTCGWAKSAAINSMSVRPGVDAGTACREVVDDPHLVAGHGQGVDYVRSDEPAPQVSRQPAV